LQKAEAQAREAQIEVSLERVRSHTMALQKSSDLHGVIEVIFSELKNLGFEMYDTNIAILDDHFNDLTFWGSSLETIKLASKIRVKPINHVYFNNISKVVDQQIPFFEYKLSGKSLKRMVEHLLTNTDYRNAPKAYQQSMLAPDAIHFSYAAMKHGALEIASDEPLTQEKANILSRFTNVIDLAYTRFDDLRQAEAQAREAQIEVALERVRAQSMAMHKSEELLKVVSVVFKQLKNLELDVVTSSISINSENTKDFNLWMASDNLDKPQKLHVPYLKHPLFDRSIAAINNGKDTINETFTLEEKNKYFKWAFENSVLKNLSDEVKNFMLNAEGYSMAVAIMKHTQVAIMKYDGIKYDEQDVEIVKRFARVFDQAYTRFLDLQKAEAQAREAQIEVALERVRARTMAMHQGDELADTSKVLFE
ncbi:MAG: hypothetical protein KAQ79_09780, partial [Cyclobacteriaceae bacterium]|nr:hypothetical protein [Cyclobacteriaceae bacterium]